MATKDEHIIAMKSADSTLYKNVNNTRIEMTTAEYNAQIDEWATNAAAQDIKDAIINDGGSHADYKEIRKNAYISELGDWGDQLDMIYHDIDDWKAKVKVIKDKYTKP
jgi:hypothetical protein